MLVKPMKGVLAVGLIALMLGSASLVLVVADGHGAYGSGAAAMTRLEPGAEHWYTLACSGSGTVEVGMEVDPDGGAAFMIVTPDAVRAWEAGEELAVTGRGADNPTEEAELFWSGGCVPSREYSLVVEYTGDGVSPSLYSLDVSGAEVSSDAATQEEPMEADIAAVKEVLGQYAVACNADDFDLWISLWADDATRMAPNAPPQFGKDQVREAVKPVFDAFDLDMAIQVEEAKVDGDLGLTRSSYTLTLTPKAGGDPIVFDPDGKALTVYERQADGSWKILYDCFNTNVPPPSSG